MTLEYILDSIPALLYSFLTPSSRDRSLVNPFVFNFLLTMHSYFLFFGILLFTGILTGSVFPLACREFSRVVKNKKVGTIYAADLIGGCMGSLIASAFFIPIFGLYQTCWFVAMLLIVVIVPYIILSR